MWVSNGLMMWSILTSEVVVCRLIILFFPAPKAYSYHVCRWVLQIIKLFK